MGSPWVERTEQAAAFLRARGVGTPLAAVELGSWLSEALPLTEAVTVPFAEIPGFPADSLPPRRLEFGRVGSRPVVALRGRAHYYEGFSLAEAAFPVRVARALGARWIALASAAAGLDPTHASGDLVLLTDHINLMGDNPLIGPHDEALGPRFPDLSRAYDAGLLGRAERAARAAGVAVRHGVYAAVAGPHHGTRAELAMIRGLGADLVGMSTAPETIVAVHSGLHVLGLCVVTALAHPDGGEPTAHEEALRIEHEAVPRVDAVLRGVIEGEEA